MISTKGKMRVHLAVKDYQDMFKDEYEALMIVNQQKRDNLINDMAEIKGTHQLKRELTSVSEKLDSMISMKLEPEDKQEWRDMDSQRWFAKEYPQFRITKQI